MSLNKLTIAGARDALRKGEVTSVEITEACIAAIDGADALNAYAHKTPERALEQAKAADARIRAGDAPAMCGIPLGVKDVFCVKGVPSQAASKILAGFKPEYESTVTQNLWNAGAVMLGKLGMDEFAMGSTTKSSCYGAVVNPWKVDDALRSPGGSSGGSAAAVAADLCLAATGTDTGGSIRQPAGFTGTVGIKPTYGRVSRWGVIAYASSLDQAGPMTKSVRDAAIMLEAMASVDPKDLLGRDPGSRLRSDADRRHSRQEDRHSARIPRRGHVGRAGEILGRRRADAEGCRRRDRRHLVAAYEIRAARLLRDRPGRGVLEPRAL